MTNRGFTTGPVHPRHAVASSPLVRALRQACDGHVLNSLMGAKPLCAAPGAQEAPETRKVWLLCRRLMTIL